MPFYAVLGDDRSEATALHREFIDAFGSPAHELRTDRFELVVFGPQMLTVKAGVSDQPPGMQPDPNAIIAVDLPPAAPLDLGHIEELFGPGPTTPPDFNTMAYRPAAGLTIAVSRYDWIPWYYATAGTAFYVSSNLFLLARALKRRADDLGELQWIAVGFNLGRRTPFAGISRTLPGDLTRVSAGGQAVTHETRSTRYELDTYDDPESAAAACWEALKGEFAPYAAHDLNLGLFLSGGLDSRLTLAAARAADVSVTTATHGQAGFEEVATAERAARAEGARHLFRSLDDGDGLLAPVDDLALLARRADTTAFPSWVSTAQTLKAAGCTAFTSGFILDVSVGGHFWDPASGRARFERRMRTAVAGPNPRMLDDPAYSPQALEDKYLRQATGLLAYRSPLFHHDYLEHLRSLLPDLRASLGEEIERLQAYLSDGRSNAPDWLVVREFYLHNHVRSYSLAQERIARTVLPLVLPTAGPIFFSAVMNVPDWMKVDHSFYFKLMRRYAKSQAAISWSATSLPVTYPAPLLELSRAVMNTRYRRSNVRYLESKGATLGSRRGALSFEAMGRRSPLETLAELVSGDRSRVDATGVSQWISEIRSFDRKSLNLLPLTELLAVQEFSS